MPLPQYKLPPFIAAPFKFSWKSINSNGGLTGSPKDKPGTTRHPICRVLEWRDRQESEKGLTKVKIAKEEGISEARVAQLFGLLHLPEDAQEYLAILTNPSLIDAYSVRQLLTIAKLPAESRGLAFAKLRANCERLVGTL